MAQKINSMRVLEQHNIPYEALPYDASIKDAEEVAEAIGVPPFMVYKTLIVMPSGEKKPIVIMIASDRELDLKAVAAATGFKKVQMARHSEAEQITGLQVGGISALALMSKNWPVYLDRAASELQHICISAGQRGLQLRVPVMPLLNLLRVRIIDASRDKA